MHFVGEILISFQAWKCNLFLVAMFGNWWYYFKAVITGIRFLVTNKFFGERHVIFLEILLNIVIIFGANRLENKAGSEMKELGY